MKVLINGCNGKMGQEVAKQIRSMEDIDVLCGVDKTDSGDNIFPVFTNIHDIDLIPDVIIDFSIPIATFNILEFAKKNSIPIVIATTGFSDKELEKISETSKKIPVFRSANMSYEINLMSKIVCEIANKLRDADIEIVETHHNRKVDSPSGTAQMLADSINESLVTIEVVNGKVVQARCKYNKDINAEMENTIKIWEKSLIKVENEC